MTLIFDENLSPRLPGHLADRFCGATHVDHLGLKGDDDISIWNRAKEIESAIIVSKDDDFRELALAFGPPPKVLMLLIGNRTTRKPVRWRGSSAGPFSQGRGGSGGFPTGFPAESLNHRAH